MSGFVDFPIDAGTNDIAYENGKIKWVKGDDEIVQRVRTRLRRLYGEWFLFYTAGIPYSNGQMLGSKDYDYAKLTIQSEILSTLGVTSVEAINLIADANTKKVSVYVEIKVNSNIYQINEEL